MGTYVRMPSYSFTLTEHDPAEPWIVRGHERQTIDLEDGVSFFEYAREHWPAPWWSVELDPWQLSPDRDVGPEH
jgi:hypothetical protein